MSIADAVDALGLRAKYKDPERWLIRALRARERELRLKVLHASGTGRRRVYRVNLATVKLALPEFVAAPDHAAKLLREPVRDIAKTLKALDERLDEMQAGIAALVQAERRRMLRSAA